MTNLYKFHYNINQFLVFLFNPIKTRGGAETARGVKMLCAAQKLIARIFQILGLFLIFIQLKVGVIFEKIAQVILVLLTVC